MSETVPPFVGHPTFTLEQAMAALGRLRATLGLPPEMFPLPAFVGMLSDEIEQMRAAGYGDAAIARIINDASGANLDASAIDRFYAPPDERRRPES